MVINNGGYTIERAIHGPEEGKLPHGSVVHLQRVAETVFHISSRQKIQTVANGLTAYNDIAAWNHQDMLQFFGAKNGKACSRVVKTKIEFEEVACLPEYIQPSAIQVGSSQLPHIPLFKQPLLT
jgi:pyruvate decarboxylase